MTSTSSSAQDAHRINGLSHDVVSRHMPSSSAGEVLPGLWIGNLMSVSHLDNLSQQSTSSDISSSNKSLRKNVIITVISVLSNPNLIRFATDALEQQRLKYANNDAQFSLFDIHHVIIPLKDAVDSDIISVLPNALESIDEALHGTNINSSSSSDGDNNKSNNLQRICLVHCAKGASRSVSVVMAYLLSRHSVRFKSFDEALRHIRTVRPQAAPNIGFALALKRYEPELKEVPPK